MTMCDVSCFDSINMPYKSSIGCAQTSYYYLAADVSASRLNTARIMDLKYFG